MRSSLLLFIFVFLLEANATEDPYSFTVRKEIVTVLGVKEGFSSVISYKGRYHSKKSTRIHIPYSELEEISNINISYWNEKGKELKVKKKDIGNTMINTGTFFSGYRSYFFNLEPQAQPYLFEYSYSQSSSLLMLNCLFELIPTIETDTLIYELRIPKDLKLEYTLSGDTSLLKSISIKRSDSELHQIFTFTAIPAMVNGLEQSYNKHIHNGTDYPRIEFITLPQSEIDGYSYLNKWYNELVEPRTQLNSRTKSVIDSIVAGISGDEERIKALFNYVKDKISYIDIENGLGAFQPRDPNEILIKQQGDCKDMANLLTRSLNYLGYNSMVALSSSIYHFTDFNFPVLSSADHVICVVNLNNNWIYLDATDPEIKFGYPSRHTQDRKIFIIGEDNGELVTVPRVPVNNNLANYSMLLKKEGNTLSGTSDFYYKGISQVEILNLINRKTASEYLPILKKVLQSLSSNIQIDSLEISSTEDSLIINGIIHSEKNFMQINDKNYLSLNFLPKPHTLPSNIDPTQKLITYKALYNNFDIIVTLDKEINSLKPITAQFNDQGIEFSFQTNQLNNNTIQFIYNCRIDHIIIEKDLLQVYDQLNQEINKVFSQALIYE